MSERMMSDKKASAISNGLFLISLGILFFTNLWWPGILIALWVTIATKQYLTGRMYDTLITSIILLGLFISTFIHFDWAVVLPVLFIVGGIYIILREYYFPHDTNGEDKSEEIKEDVDIDPK